MRRVNVTQGVLSKDILIYSFPLILSTILQTLFSIADKAVLGNMAGTVAVASIAATGTVSSLIINGAIGLSSGTAIVLARSVGQRDEKKVRETIDTSLIASIFIGFIVAVAGFILAPVFLTATNCPKECYDGALVYMRITLAAAPVTLFYNYGSAILRTLGDSESPLKYITIAGVINVILNVVLCLILQNKVVAVAVATLVSQVVSSILTFRKLCLFDDSARVIISKMRFCFSSFLRVLRFGIPASISNLILPLGNFQIASAINTYGPNAIAGHSAAISVESISYAFCTGFGSATMTFMGQNIGAGNTARVRKTFWLCMMYSTLITGTLGVLTYLTGRFWLGIIVGMSSTAAINYGMTRLFHVVLFVFLYAISSVLISAMKAFGYPMLTSITNIAINLGFRVFWMQFIYPLSPKFNTIMLCYTFAWTLNLIFYIIFNSVVYTRYVKKGLYKKI